MKFETDDEFAEYLKDKETDIATQIRMWRMPPLAMQV
jgi:hypothetical protein